MKISVKSFRGIESANIEANPICLLAGLNYAGKSSICLAIASALTGHVMPYLKMSGGKPVGIFTKSQSGTMVRGGVDKGSVSIETDIGVSTVTWPDMDYKTKGEAPHASIYAAGLLSLLDMDEKARNAFLADLLGTKPSREDLIEALPELSDEQIKRIWDAIEKDGWDIAYKAVKETGAKLKGQYELTTNDRYGATKASGWIPQGWDERLSALSVENLESDLANRRQELEQLIAKTAVDEGEIVRLRNIIQTPQDASDYESQLALARAAHAKAIEERNGLPPLEGPLTTIPCPHCEKPLIIVGQNIQAPPTRLSKAESAKRRKDFDAAVENISKARLAVEDLERKLSAQTQADGIVKGAVSRLAEFEAKKEKVPSESAINKAREDVRLAEESLRLFVAKTTADRMHASIERNQKIIDLLAPDGLRKNKLLRVLEAFNNSLRELCDPAGFKAVSVDEAMDIRYGGRHYALLSASEQYRVRAILQTAIALRDGSQMVIFDGADILDNAGREGLFALLQVINIFAIVAMTINKQSAVPDLRSAGIGESFWVSSGNCMPLNSAQSVAA